MRIFGLLFACALLCVSGANAQVLSTGGANGDYYGKYGPPTADVISKAAWNPGGVKLRVSQGTPDNMQYVLEHPSDFGFAQGDIFFGKATEAPYAGKLRALRTDIGNEVVIAVVTPAIYNLSEGQWASIAAHASRVKFATSSESSGPAATFKLLQQLDPDGLGKAENVHYFPGSSGMDDAIGAVANGTANVALMVQAANPENERFKRIAAAGLKIVPVLSSGMRTFQAPGFGRVYNMCTNVDVGVGKPFDTACSPIVLFTGSANSDEQMLQDVTKASVGDFAPHESAFARIWHSVKRATSETMDAAIEQANRVAASVADKWKS